MNGYCQELHETYQTTISAFEKSYPLTDPDLMRQIDNYSRACALYLWSSFNVDIVQCVEAINAIYSSVSRKVEYTEANVRTAMGKLSSGSHSMPVPRFFHSIIDYDVKHSSNISRRLAACFQLLDISYAMIDETIQTEEVDIISALQKDLIKECDKKHVSTFKNNSNTITYSTNCHNH